MTGIEIFDSIEQGTGEWFAVRLGIPTASMFKAVMASGRSGSDSKTRTKYLRQLAGERITGEQMVDFYNADMERGKKMEDEARNYYALMAGVDPVQVGFIRSGPANFKRGCSPDALVGTDGLLEIKTKSPHVLIEVLESDTVPSEHVLQIQGQIWVSAREWCDLCGYWPKMPKFIKRVPRDEALIAKMADAVDEFNGELFDLTEKLRKMMWA